MQRTENEQREGDDEAGGANPVVEIPAMLLRLPVSGEMGGGPELDAIVDGDRSDEREKYGEYLDGEGRLREVSGEDPQVLKGQQKKQVQEGGSGHPERHDAAEEDGKGGPNGDVDFRRMPVECGMTEGGNIQFTATYQA